MAGKIVNTAGLIVNTAGLINQDAGKINDDTGLIEDSAGLINDTNDPEYTANGKKMKQGKRQGQQVEKLSTTHNEKLATV